jgi:transcriptional regulator with XRE-family HTH domain
MKIEASQLIDLAKALAFERKRQKLSREEAASVCGVSTSFIRDAEADPANCSLGKLLRLMGGLGLSLNVAGLAQADTLLAGTSNKQASNQRPDFGVPAAQLVPRSKGGE